MSFGTLETLEVIGWIVLMYWLLSMTKNTRKDNNHEREEKAEASASEKSPET